MVVVDINDTNNEKLFSIEIDSVDLFHRNKKIIENYLSFYIYEFKTDQLLDEMKKGLQLIFDSDIKILRKRKLEKISQNYRLPFGDIKKKTTHMIDISFVASKENF